MTGGAGFIGSHLCEQLIDQGHSVVCLDNFYTGRRQNIARLLSHPRFECLRHDINEPLTMDVDQVYHLACPASPVHYQRNPVRTIRTCVQGTLHVLELSREVTARLLIASTSEVYGDPAVHPQTERYNGNVNPIGIRACYDEGKRCAEALAVSYAQQYGVDVRIARIFNTYGPRMDEQDGRVVSNFIVQALRDEPITLYGDGGQTRSFCYVDDLVDGLVALMNVSCGAEPVNLGNPREITIAAFAAMVRDMIGSMSAIAFRPLPQDDPVRRCPDIRRATELLRWSPKIQLEDGLRKTVGYFRGLAPIMVTPDASITALAAGASI